MKNKFLILLIIPFFLLIMISSCTLFPIDSGDGGDGGDTGPPDIPTGLTASDGTYSDKIKVSWDDVSNATMYHLYMSDSENGTYNEIKNTTNTSYNVLNAPNGDVMWFKVKAYNDDGFSDYSEAEDGYMQTKTYILSVLTDGYGSVTLDPPGGTYDENTTVTLTASPDANWEFTSWTGAYNGTNNPVDILMNEHKTITGHFQEIKEFNVIFDVDADIYQSTPPTGSTYELRMFTDLDLLTDNGSDLIIDSGILSSYDYNVADIGVGSTGNINNVDAGKFDWTILREDTDGTTYSFTFSNTYADIMDNYIFFKDRTYTISIPTDNVVELTHDQMDDTDQYVLEVTWQNDDNTVGLLPSTAPVINGISNMKISTKGMINSFNYNSFIQEESTKQIQIPDKFEQMKKSLDEFDRIMVKLKDDSMLLTKSGKIAEKFETLGKVQYHADYPVPELITVTPKIDRKNMSYDDWKNMIEYYESLPEVEYAEPDYFQYPLWTPNDPDFSDQWQFQSWQLNMEAVWDITQGNSSVIVAVIDSGINTTLSDAPSNLLTGYDFVNSDNDPNDENGHGSHVAGTIAQATNNNNGVVGMAPNVTILPVKVLGPYSGYQYDTIQGINYAVNQNADIINMSLGNTNYSSTYQSAITSAYNAGITIFAATGNDNTGTINYPAKYSNVIAVGATSTDQERSYYSNYGSDIDIVAPGGEVFSNYELSGILQNTIVGIVDPDGDADDPDDDNGNEYVDTSEVYSYYQGTSMASPHAAALGALLKSVDATLTPDNIESIIESTADDLIYTSTDYGANDNAVAGFDIYTGHGLINPLQAIDYVAGTYEVFDNVSGNIATAGNSDFWEFHAITGPIDISLTFTHSSNDLDLFLYNPSGTQVASSESTNDTETISYNATEDGIYKIEVYWYTP